MKAIAILFLAGFLAETALAAPPYQIRGANNQVIGRVYKNPNSARYYGRYNESVGSSRTSSGVTTFYNNRGVKVGTVYGKK